MTSWVWKKKLQEPQKTSGNQGEKPLHSQENNKQNPKETRERNELKYIWQNHKVIPIWLPIQEIDKNGTNSHAKVDGKLTKPHPNKELQTTKECWEWEK